MHERIIDNAVSICYLGIVCPSLQYFIVRFTVSTIDMYGYIDIMSAQVYAQYILITMNQTCKSILPYFIPLIFHIFIQYWAALNHDIL